MMTAQQFLQPVIDDLKVQFRQANIRLYPMIAEQRHDDDTKYELTLIVGRDNELFDEGGKGEKILQQISHKHKQYLGLGMCESIGTCADCWGTVTKVVW